MSTSACVIRSLLTTAPMVVRLRCSAIGPSSSWSARATSPSVPWVGISVLPVAGGGDADGPGEAAGDPDGAGDALGFADSGWRDGAALELAAGLPLAPALELAPGEALVLGAADGTTSRKSAGFTVLISMKPDPVVIAIASRPCWRTPPRPGRA